MAVLKTPSVLKEKGICHMKTPSISTLPDPSGFSVDLLTDILRAGARDLIQQAVEAELSALLATQAQDLTADGRARLVRHGHLPERDVVTGIGPVPVKVPRVRDRGDSAEKIRFTSAILPPYLRKAKIRRRAFALAVSERHFHGRLPGSSGGFVGAKRSRPVIDNDFTS